MGNKGKRYLFLLICILLISTFSGCSLVNKIEKKLGWKNEYFEYLNNDNVEQISIQSTRDLGFKFIVTEPSAISEMYGLLSRAKVSENKSELEPDYIFEFNLGNEVKNFYYVVGTDEGNFYNDDITFSVSKRLDEGIIKNLSFIRKPRDFEYVYYDSILEVLNKTVNGSNKKEEEKNDIKGLNVGIDINGDIDCLKYVFSSDLNNFLEEANKIIPGVKVVENNSEEFNVIINVKNRGYDSTNFKTLITVNNKSEKTQEEYYIVAKNEFKEWNIEVSGPNPDKTPDGW